MDDNSSVRGSLQSHRGTTGRPTAYRVMNQRIPLATVLAGTPTHEAIRLSTHAGATTGARLMALAVYGSVGRGTPRWDSDVDLLVVANGLPHGRFPRVDDIPR